MERKDEVQLKFVAGKERIIEKYNNGWWCTLRLGVQDNYVGAKKLSMKLLVNLGDIQIYMARM
eukprot:12318168-Karenia_brevis.AAC.1